MALRRQMKNVVKNFSDIEVKVREATSNDPWGPSSSLTSEIADATYNVAAFSEIMTLLWKRINDHGKNWRHVYKSLVVLDYIVKTGSERVAQQCRENIFAIKTLKDFQFIDKDGKDQGVNVREKSKQLVALLKDDERLKSERQRALKAKERFSQSQGGIGNTSFPKNKKFQGTMKYPETKGSVDDTNIPTRQFEDRPTASDSRSMDGRIDSEIEKVRPSNEAEEEMQLQIALAMSREEAEHEEKTQDDDDKILNMANQSAQQQPTQQGTLLNLSDPAAPAPQQSSVTMIDPWSQSPQTSLTQAPRVQPVADPWGAPIQVPSASIAMSSQPSNASMNQPPATDPWNTGKPIDPWATPATSTPQIDPWGSAAPQPTQDPFGSLSSAPTPEAHIDPFASVSNATDSSTAGDSLLMPSNMSVNVSSEKPSFLANGAHLVDVDNILAPKPTTGSVASVNPFMTSPGASSNPFLQDKPKPKSINEIRSESNIFASAGPGNTLLPTPLNPSQSSTNNPFL